MSQEEEAKITFHSFFDGEKNKSTGAPRGSQGTKSLLALLPPRNTSISVSSILSRSNKIDARTVDEPRRPEASWRMRPAAAAAASAGNGEQSTNPLVVSFPAGFYPPVSGWEAYEGGAGGQQLLVVARAVRKQ